MTVQEGHWDAIIVGSGIGGLSCAAHLAKKG
jgi:phytoene dehydrogenase-like protein